jgi:hypothetical protein
MHVWMSTGEAADCTLMGLEKHHGGAAGSLSEHVIHTCTKVDSHSVQEHVFLSSAYPAVAPSLRIGRRDSKS